MKYFIFIFFFSIFSFYGFLFFLESRKPKLLYSSEEDKIYVYSIHHRLFDREKICLRFSPIIGKLADLQGCIYKNYPDQIAFNYAKITLSSLYFNPKPTKILILGLGIGTIPKALSKLLPDSQIDTVDINDKLDEVNKKYFHFDISKYQNINFHLMDAFEFIEKKIQNDEKYDLIVSDLFDDTYIPEKFLTNEYMRNIKKIMSDDGLFVINSFENSKTRTAEDILIKNNFGKNFVYFADGNKIIITTSDNISIPMKKPDIVSSNISLFTEKFKKLDIDEDWLISKIKYN